MQWHRLFGLLLTDFFTGSPFIVKVEPDLSWQQQRLDVVIVRKGRGRFKETLPDGLDDLGTHNLITFKSHQDALDGWAMCELIGHYVSYRKLISSSVDELLPASQFQLYAVCARFPHNLAQQVPWQQSRPGVYHCRWRTELIRVVVPRQLPEADNNAPLHLFAADPELVRFGRSHYRQRAASTSTLLSQLFEKYEREGVAMPYTMEDFLEDYVVTHLEKVSPERLRNALRGLSPEKLREALQGLSPEQLEQTLSPEQIEYLRQHGAAPAPGKSRNAGRADRKRRRS